MDSAAPPVKSVRFGDILTRGFRAYVDHIGEWMPPMLVAAAIAVVSYLCCVIPFLIVVGPLVCALDYCAICVIRGRPIDAATLGRGRDVAGRAFLAYWALQLLYFLPVLLIVALGVVLFAIVGAFQPELFAPPNPPGGQVVPVAERRADEDASRADEVEPVDEPERLAPPAQAMQPPAGQPVGNPNPLPILLLFTFYVVALVASLIGAVWMFWLSTRLIFVTPLIADRQTGVREAFRLSWESTRSGFWELLLLNLLAGLAASLGIQLCYIGVIFTLPVAFTLIASAYVERFPEEAAELVLDDAPATPGEPMAT